MATPLQKREKLIKAARDLLHSQGYSNTTLSDIAELSGVPLGNVYYYFKTKQDIAMAVVEERRNELLGLYQKLDQDIDDPRQRLMALLNIASGWCEDIARHGCPIGSLCQELNNYRDALSEKADVILSDQIEWMTTQFELLGMPSPRQLAIQLISRLQGSSLVSNSLQDKDIMHQQLTSLKDWLKGLTPVEYAPA